MNRETWDSQPIVQDTDSDFDACGDLGVLGLPTDCPQRRSEGVE